MRGNFQAASDTDMTTRLDRISPICWSGVLIVPLVNENKSEAVTSTWQRRLVGTRVDALNAVGEFEFRNVIPWIFQTLYPMTFGDSQLGSQ